MLSAKKLMYKVLSFFGGDGDWKTLTSDCKYFKKSGIVTVTYYSATRSITSSYQTIGTLPVGYRPSTTLYLAGMTVSAVDQIVVAINPSGLIQIRLAGSGSTTYSGFTASFPVVGGVACKSVIARVRAFLSSISERGWVAC